MPFLVCEAAQRLKKSSLIQLDQLIGNLFVKEWGILIAQATVLRLYDPLKMLKALAVQTWNSLSDEALEEVLRAHLDFMVITGLEHVPDATAICRFRNSSGSDDFKSRRL